MSMIFEYENLLVIGVLIYLNLKKSEIWMIWECLEILDVRSRRKEVLFDL